MFNGNKKGIVTIGRIGPVQVFCLLFILCVFCVSATHVMRNESHGVFRFNTVVREGAVGVRGGCEPKDIIALGDRLSSDSIISGFEQNKKITEAINKSKSTDDKVHGAWNRFQAFVMMAKGAATMRSKPDEQALRKVMAEGAAKKDIDCAAFSNLSKSIETVAGLSAEQKNAIKKYATEMVNMGQCLGWCK